MALDFNCCLLVLYFRVGLEMPTIEVRYENLTVKANCHIGSRGLPTLWNVFLNIVEVVISYVVFPSGCFRA